MVKTGVVNIRLVGIKVFITYLHIWSANWTITDKFTSENGVTTDMFSQHD